MNKNIGTVDRIIRIILGLAILGAGWYFGSWLGLIGIIPIATALVGFCPVYCPLKISTCGGTCRTGSKSADQSSAE